MNKSCINLKSTQDYAAVSKPRESNMELLRIVAMLLVMIIHSDFRALGVPSLSDFVVEPSSTIMRFLIASFSIICVDTFVLLSGWFGIRFRMDRLIELIFQVLFFLILGFCIAIFTVPAEALSLRGVTNFLLLDDKDYWFVKCYLLMYFFAPIMNAFVENSTEHQLRIFLICFYVFQTIYGFISGAEWFRLGYSGISFIGLYMLARYVRLYPNKLTTLNKGWDIIIYLVIVAVMTLLAVAMSSVGTHSTLIGKVGVYYPKLINRVYAYSSPLVIISALYFLLFFSKVKLNFNRIVNCIAVSSLAVYLVHSNSWLANTYYDSYIRYCFTSFSGCEFFIRVILFIVSVFVFSILIDKLRIILYKAIRGFIIQLKS